jgi:hypothetical protein
MIVNEIETSKKVNPVTMPHDVNLDRTLGTAGSAIERIQRYDSVRKEPTPPMTRSTKKKGRGFKGGIYKALRKVKSILIISTPISNNWQGSPQ